MIKQWRSCHYCTAIHHLSSYPKIILTAKTKSFFLAQAKLCSKLNTRLPKNSTKMIPRKLNYTINHNHQKWRQSKLPELSDSFNTYLQSRDWTKRVSYLFPWLRNIYTVWKNAQTPMQLNPFSFKILSIPQAQKNKWNLRESQNTLEAETNKNHKFKTHTHTIEMIQNLTIIHTQDNWIPNRMEFWF